MPEVPDRLRTLSAGSRWLRWLWPGGLLLAAAALVLTFAAPTVVWFLLYPLLIVGALALLTAGAALLIRHL